MLKAAIPLVHVDNADEALRFYCGRLGFALRSTYRPDPAKPDPSYHVIARDEALLHLSSFSGDGKAGGAVTIVVDDIVRIHDELVANGVDVGLGVMDQSWGDREVYVRDPAGNSVRFQSA